MSDIEHLNFYADAGSADAAGAARAVKIGCEKIARAEVCHRVTFPTLAVQRFEFRSTRVLDEKELRAPSH
jgi:hypothetical protein